MRVGTKLLGIILPLATLFVLLMLFGADVIKGVGPTPDLKVYVLELAVRTIYAVAVFGAVVKVMDWTGLNVDNADMARMWQEAQLDSGQGRAARKTLLLQAAVWVAMLVLSIWVFSGLG